MKYVVTVISFLLFLSVLAPRATSQDIHYSQVSFSPVYTNPAFTGYFDGNLRMYANYRNQFFSVLGGSAFQTYSGAVDFSMPVGLFEKDFVGAGAFAFHDRVGKPEDGGQLISNAFGLSGSYSKSIAKNGDHALTIGLMALFLQRRFEGTDLYFGSQYDQLTGEIIPTPPPSEIGPGEVLNYTTFDFGFGLVYLGKLSDNMVLYTGFSLMHLLQPRWSFIESDDARLPMRFGGQLGLTIDLNRRLDMSPIAFFQHQGKVGELVMGDLLDYRIIQDKGIETDMLFGMYFRTLHSAEQAFSFESLIVMLGIEYTDLRIAFTYDAHLGGLREVTNTNSAFEVSIKYELSWLNSKSITRHCPRF